MSAFVVYHDPSGAPTDTRIFERAMNRLSHRGPDGQQALVNGTCTMGYWHFWTTPEEVGERQPVRLSGLPFTMVFDGRLDNRGDLFDRLLISPQEGLSDAVLALRAYSAWGERCVEYFIGEFALVLYDEKQQTLFCARDPLGERTLFYAWLGARLLIASEPWAVQSVQGGSVELDEKAIIHYFMMHATQSGQSLFKDVLELLPGHRMLVQGECFRLQRYWQPDTRRKIRYGTEREYVDHFYALLEESVRCRMRANTPVGILMSGGLDSTSVACLAANMSDQPLKTVSFTYTDLPGADESKYIDAISARWNTHSIKLTCDDLYPFQEPQKWSRNPNQPEHNVYWSLNDHAYQRIHAEGSRVLLTGMFGDNLYGGMMDWLFDLFREWRFIEGIWGTLHCIRDAGLRRNWRAGYMQNVVKNIPKIFGSDPIQRRKSLPAWFTPFSSELLRETDLHSFDNDYTPVGAWTAQKCSNEIFAASLHSVELRNPYRDRRLVEFMMAIPAYLLFRPCFTKYILRMAMEPLMPDLVRLRREQTSFLPLFLRGLEHEKDALQNRLDASCNQELAWRKFVRADWVSMRWDSAISPDKNDADVLVPWMSLAYEAWHNRLISTSI